MRESKLSHFPEGRDMPNIVAYADVAANRKPSGRWAKGSRWRTEFILPAQAGVPEEAHAFLYEVEPGHRIETHFHGVDEFQVIVRGKGTLGRHPMPHNMVHFARAATPYGPIVCGDEGVGFLTLRAMRDPSKGHHFPEGKAVLESMTGRDPWQVTEIPTFDRADGVALRAFPKMKDERGLSGFSLTLPAGAKTLAPTPANSSGQFVVIVEGTLRYQGRDYQAPTVIFLKSDENPFELEAASGVLSALVLNFPRRAAATPGVAAGKPAAAKPAFRVWQCRLCSFVYDEERGMPEDGIAPGTPWESVPESWSCPDCSASKSDFDMQLI